MTAPRTTAFVAGLAALLLSTLTACTAPQNTVADPTRTSSALADLTTTGTGKTSTTFAVPATGYQVDITCAGTQDAEITLTATTPGQRADAGRNIPAQTARLVLQCDTVSPWQVNPDVATKGKKATFTLAVTKGTVKRATATVKRFNTP